MELLLDSELIVQRHQLALLALGMHGMFYGGALLLHRIAPYDLPRALQHLWLHRIIAPWVFRAEDKLNRADRSPSKRAWRGSAVLVMALVASWVAATTATLLFVYVLPSPFLVAVLLASLLPIGPHMMQLYAVWREEGETQLPTSSYPAITLLDQAHLRRTHMERGARGMVEMVTLLISFVVAELHGAMAISVLCLLYHAVSVPNLRYRPFGILTRILYELICFVPAAIVTIACILAGLVTPHCHPLASLRAIGRTSAPKEKESVAPFPAFYLRAHAACIGVSLGGPYRCDEETIHVPWIGEKTANVTLHHLITTLWHGTVTAFVILLAFAALAT